MTSRPLRPEDAAALIGVTAVLEGHLLAGDLAPHLVAAAGEPGESTSPPAAVDGRAYDGEVRWEVVAGTSELPLSGAFDEHVKQLHPGRGARRPLRGVGRRTLVLCLQEEAEH